RKKLTLIAMLMTSRISSTCLALSLWGCAVLVGCGGKTPEPASLGSLPVSTQGDIKVDRSLCDDKGKQVVEADTNQDKKTDVWKLYLTVQSGGQNAQVLTCKQVDLNHDGKIDIVYHFAPNGMLSLEEFDLDLDGKFDAWVYYQGGKKVREEMDMNLD